MDQYIHDFQSTLLVLNEREPDLPFLTKQHVLCSHLYKTEKFSVIYNDRKQRSGCKEKGEAGRRDAMMWQEPLQGGELIYSSRGSGFIVHTYVDTCQIVCFKYMWFNMRQLNNRKAAGQRISARC